jgi:hypothetical protein
MTFFQEFFAVFLNCSGAAALTASGFLNLVQCAAAQRFNLTPIHTRPAHPHRII